MSVTALQILDCGIECSSDGAGREEFMRAAIGRAYYSAFHDSLTWEEALPLKGVAPAGTGGRHAQLSSRLVNPDFTLPIDTRTRSKQRGYILRSLHPLRVTADYHLLDDVDSDDARQAIADARRVHALL